MSDEVIYRRTGRGSVVISHTQAVFLEGRQSAQTILTRKLEKKGIRCQIDSKNKVIHFESESEVDPAIVSRELDKLIVEQSFKLDPGQAALLSGKRDGEVLMSLDDAVVVGGRGALIGLTKSVDGLSLNVTEILGEETREETDMAEANTCVTITVSMSEEKYSYLSKYKQNDMKALGSTDVVIDFVHSSCGSQYAVQITGAVGSVMSFKERILRLLQDVITSRFFFGVRSDLTNGSVNGVVKDITGQNECTARIQTSVDHVDLGIPDDAQKLSSTGEDPFVTVIFNELQKQEADVIVNTLHRNLTLGVGKVSSALLKSCGREVQDELRVNYPDGINNGEMAVSSSGRMKTCQQIYHGALPAYKGLGAVNKQTCYQNMILLMYNCLQKASTSGHVTIAFPALGTGVLEYPTQDVAYLMFRAVRLFLAQSPYTSLEQIYFVLHPSAPLELKQIFLAHCVSQTVETSVVDALSFEAALGQGMEELEVIFRVGHTLMKVVNADLTKACHKSCPQLVLFDEADTQDTQVNRNYPSGECSITLSDFLTTQTAFDNDPSPCRTVLKSYEGTGSEKDIKDAIKMGLERVHKENIHMLALSVLSTDRLASNVTLSALSVMQGVKESKASVFVFAVFIPDRDVFSDFVTAARGVGYEPLKDLENQSNSLLDRTWDDFSQAQIRGAMGIMETGNTALLTVTSDSEQTNRRVAREIQGRIRADVSRGNILSGSTSSTDPSSSTDSLWESFLRTGTNAIRDIQRAFKW